jgi:cellobiose phosphorylase
MIGHLRDMEVVREILTAHTFWHLRGLKVDLVLVSEEVASYEEPLTEHLRRLTEAQAHLTGVDQPGGVYLRSATKISKEELLALQAAARMVLVAARGTLRQQLAASAPAAAKSRQLLPARQFHEEPSAPLPFMELKYFNGLGGFTEDGKEFVIYLGPNRHTPLPWINIMANPKFGSIDFRVWGRNVSGAAIARTIVSRRGSTIRSAIRPEQPSTSATTRSAPCGLQQPNRFERRTPYRARHGQGYTTFEHNSHAIEQRLLTFVPVDDAGGRPVRLQRLRLRNNSSRRRKLTVTAYATLVLGSDPEETGMHVVTKWDLQSQTLFARNSYNPEFCDCITFATSAPTPTSFTADRAGSSGVTARCVIRRRWSTNDCPATWAPALTLVPPVQVIVEIEPGTPQR